jgi:hypothetical protein
MMYALEWYDIPRTAYSDLVEFHPYLANSDYTKLYNLNSQNRVEKVFGFGFFTLLSNRLLLQKVNFCKPKFVRVPCAIMSGVFSLYLFDRMFLQHLYYGEMRDAGLD